MIPDPAEHPTLTVEEAAAALGIGRSKAYVEARRFLRSGGAEGMPALRFGRCLRVPTAALRQMLSLDMETEPARSASPAPSDPFPSGAPEKVRSHVS